MLGYRNAVYNYKNQVVDIYTWSNAGDRIVTSIECFPYFYYEDNSGSDISIFNTNLKKKHFNNVFDKSKFLKERGLKRVFDNYNPVQQSLIDMYWNYNDTEDFAKFPLKIYFIDIEAVGKLGFSSPSEPNDEINVITVYDSFTNKYHVWGTKPYTSKSEDVEYYYCNTEYILLEKFLDFLKSDYPDILSGWNCISNGQYVWLNDRIEKIDNLSYYLDNHPLKTYGGRINNHAMTGIKEEYCVKTELGYDILCSDKHKIMCHSKLVDEYKNKNTLGKIIEELTVSNIKTVIDNKEKDVYARIHVGSNINADLTYREFLVDFFDEIEENPSFDFAITCAKLRDKLRSNEEFRKLISHEEYYNGKFWERSSNWRYSIVKSFLNRSEVIDFLKTTNNFVFNPRGRRYSIDLNKRIPEQLIQLLGYIFTDGCLDKKDKTITVSSKDFDLVDSYTKIVSSYVNKTLSSPKTVNHKLGICYSKKFSLTNEIGFMLGMIYNKDLGKQPNIRLISRLSYSQFYHFFAGMIDGDGWIGESAINLCNFDCKKYNFLLDIQQILLWNGVISYKSEDYVSIPMFSKNVEFVNKCGEIMHNTERSEKIKNIKESPERNSSNKSIRWVFDEIKSDILVKIRSIESTGKMVEMYDIETEDHVFLCNGMLVHNCDRYDIPYIINRMEKVLGKEETDTISPYKRRYTKVFNGKFGKKEIVHRIDGVSCVDYMDIYKKFCPVNRESYKLDYIGQVELQENKLDYGDQSLYEFMMEDWETFVDYNIQDVKLLVNLEKKLQYIQLLRMLSYIGCTTFESALGTVGVVTGAAGIEARKRNQRLCTFVVEENEEPRDFEGGFVFHPIPGHHTSIVSFDANSLYPNTMITLNTSPETKMGKIESIQKDKISVRNIDGVVIDFTPINFLNYLKKENISLSKANVLFSQKKKGILADLVDIYYKKRVSIRQDSKNLKTKLKNENEIDKQNLENKIDQLDTKQQAIKIFLNSVYGACANKFCPIGDVDIAESITLTGQSVIKESREIFKRFITEKTGISDISELSKGLIAGDTDSLYVSFDQLVDKFSENNKITPQAYEIAEEFQTYLNDNIKKWAKNILNTKDCRFEFKRENMCDAGIFLEKKRYVLHVLDKEGIPSNSWKYTGVEVVTTTMPKAVKPYVKSIIENIILTKCESSTNDLFRKAYDTFFQMDISEISISKGIKNLEKYEALCEDFVTCKGMPCHVKSAYYYNLLLDKLGITNKYEKIVSGDKLKYFYLETPNVYGISTIAFKNKYPIEFKSIFKPDIYTMFEKDMFMCIERFYKIMNWIPRKPTEQLICSLDDILG